MPDSKRKDDDFVLLQRRLVIICLSLLIAYLTLQVAQTFSDILRILAISIFATYTVSSLVDWLERFLKQRARAVIAVYAFLGILTVFGIVLVLPTILVQVSQLVDVTINELPNWISKFETMIAPLEERLTRYHLPIKSTDLGAFLAANLPHPDGSVIAAQMTGVAMSTMTWMFYGLSVMLLTFYFLLDGSRMTASLIKLCPKRQQLRITDIVIEIDASLHAFFRGQIILGLAFGAFMVVVYAVLGVQYALALGLILGIWEIVPVIGPTLGFLPALLSVLILGMSNFQADRFLEVLILVVVFNVLQWLKDNIIAPRYIGDAIGLHPVLIFIAIMIGARLDGMLGIIVSLPIAGAAGVLIRYVFRATDPTSSTDNQDEKICDEKSGACGEG